MGVGRLFAISTAAAPKLEAYDTLSPAWNAVQNKAREFLVGDSDGNLHLVPETTLKMGGRKIALGGELKGAPALGEDGSVYVATSEAKLHALDKDGKVRWSVALGKASESSPALDCARNPDGTVDKARPGVLYVGANDGKLYSFIVDSRGLDTDAPWPKFHRDPQNTDDANVNLKDVVCK